LKENFDRFKLKTYKEKEMVDFRRMIPVLAVIALLLGLAVTASAQTPNLSCVTNGAVPNQVRGEGLAEQMGDFLITCTGGVPTAAGLPVPSVNISITLGNINITSRLMSTSTTLPQLSEAVVTIDEPAAGAQFGCAAPVCTNIGTGTGAGAYGPGTANKNIFQGTLETNNRMTFFAVPVDPPGTAPGATRIFRITNVRGNASQAGISNVAVQIFETVSVSNFAVMPVTGLATQAVASVQRGLIFSVGSSATSTSAFTVGGLQQCVSRSSDAAAVFFLRYQEGFGTAFKKRITQTTSTNPLATGEQNTVGSTAPGPYNTESMYTTGSTSLQSNTVSGSCPGGTCAIGQADYGTRLKAVFNNIPNGINLFVDRFATANSSADIAQMTASETGGFSLVAATASAPGGNVTIAGIGTVGAAAQLTVTNNSATAVWEVTDSQATTLATLAFRVWVTYTASPATNSPALGTATVNGSFAPTSTVITASNVLVPRFADLSTLTPIFTVVPCATNLLFPYVTSQFGFDTGVAISATSIDPFGTSGQSGTCTLNWYGQAFTGATPTPVINAGTSWANNTSVILSNVTGGFTGYMIAVCRFQYAHGFAFISDLGARQLAMGYLALVIPDPPRAANPFPAAGNNSGEQLGY